MKRTFMKFLPIAAAILLVTSCSKDGDNNVVTNPVDNPTHVQEQEATPTTLTMTFKVSASAGLSKIGIASGAESGTVAPKFEVYDEIHFADADNKVTATVKLTADNIKTDGTTAEFVVEKFSGSDDDLALFEKGEISLTATMGSQLTEISEGYSTLEAAIRANSYQVSGEIKYSETQTDITFTEQTSYLEISSPQATVDINGNSFTLTDGKVYVAAPANTEITSLALGLNNITKQGKIHTITRHYSPKSFSVSETETVTFSSGNLQYNPTTSKWRFAPHQWDVCHKDSYTVGDNYAEWSGKWTDLFGWGMWLASNGEDPISPTNTSTESAAYLPSITNYGETFSGASAIGSEWATLTTEQWQYLCNSRGYFNDKRKDKHGIGIIHSITGFILLPDDYKEPKEIVTKFVPGTTRYRYSDEDWAKMEAAGAVFLPLAGHRQGKYIYQVGDRGYYWSSTLSDVESLADDLYCDNGSVSASNRSGRSLGFSVRLVRFLE